MRNAVIGFILVIILVFTGAAVNSAESKTVRKNELESKLSAAMEQSLRILTVNPVYPIRSEGGAGEFTADFIQNFLAGTTSDSDYHIEILHVDEQKGLLDVKVTERYRQISGTGKVSLRKTVLLDRIKNQENRYYTLTFYNGYVLKQVNIHGGDNISEAMLPKTEIDKEGHLFSGWKMKQPDTGKIYSNAQMKQLTVTENMEFEAVYKKK